MSTYSWRTNRDGYVEVDTNGSGNYVAIETTPNKNTQRVLNEWVDLARRNSAKHGVPVPWILAFIYSETGGDPTAENWCCAGLMAIYYKQHNMTREEALDPEICVDKATSWIAYSMSKGYDLPQCASIHNAGGGTTTTPWPSAKSNWGMRENAGDDGGFIERVVRSQNYFRRVLSSTDGLPDQKTPVEPAGSFISKIIPLAAGIAFGYYAIKIGVKYTERYVRKHM